MTLVTWAAPNGEVITADTDSQMVHVWVDVDLIGDPVGLVVGPWEFDHEPAVSSAEQAGETYRLWAACGRPGDLRKVP